MFRGSCPFVLHQVLQGCYYLDDRFPHRALRDDLHVVVQFQCVLGSVRVAPGTSPCPMI
jgi:hypothetical protein